MNNKKLFFSVASVLIVMCAILSGCTEKNERELEQKAIEKEQWDIGKNVDEGLPQDRLNKIDCWRYWTKRKLDYGQHKRI